MGVRISNLTEGTPSSSDYFAFDGANGSKKASYSLIEDKADRADVLPLINQWDEQYEIGGYNFSTGEKTTASNTLRTSNAISVKPNTTYYNHSSVTLYVLYYGSNGSYLGNEYDTQGNATFTTPANAYFMRFVIPSSYGTTYNNDISINYPSTYTGYYPSALPRTNAHVGGLGNVIGMRGWNQLAKKISQYSININQSATYEFSGNGIKITPSSSFASGCYIINSLESGHKYFSSFTVKSESGNMNLLIGHETYTIAETSITSSKMRVCKLFTANTTATTFVMYRTNGALESFYVNDLMLIDLTALFGEGNEPSSVEDFRAMYPAKYYPFHNNVNSLADLNYTVVSTWS